MARRGGIPGALLCFLVWTFAALAQGPSPLPRIWDVHLGMHIDGLPQHEFVEPGCGNRGGPKGRALESFKAFTLCAPEASGLREIWFMYDDTREFAELARREAVHRHTTAVLDQPVVLSLLVNERGYVQGYRIYTDTRAPEVLRLHAHEVALHFKARFSLDDVCIQLPPAAGETPIEGEYIKEHCERHDPDRQIVSDERLYFRPGQQQVDPNSGLAMSNAFESSASLEVRLTRQNELARPMVALEREAEVMDDQSKFLAGLSRDCPRCDLRDADLRYRNLENANLERADLEGALLHAANLRGAMLAGARLDGANLNRTNLSFAKLASASFVRAMLYQADLRRAEIDGADFSRALMGRANLAFAQGRNTAFEAVDLGEARLTDVSLPAVRMAAATLAQAVLSRAKLPGADLTGANLAGARLNGSDLSGASLPRADLTAADLSQADVSGADLSGATLVSADLTAARQAGARLSGARMPDNSRHP